MKKLFESYREFLGQLIDVLNEIPPETLGKIEQELRDANIYPEAIKHRLSEYSLLISSIKENLKKNMYTSITKNEWLETFRRFLNEDCPYSPTYETFGFVRTSIIGAHRIFTDHDADRLALHLWEWMESKPEN